MANRLLKFLLLLTTVSGPISGDVLLRVSPYPARIYEKAGPDVPVLTVQGYENITGTPVTSFRLQQKNDANYFKIDSSGVIRTSQAINFEVGKIFEFFVHGTVNNQDDSRHVKIVVCKKNMYQPRFSEPIYTFFVYRYGVGDKIGNLTVIDQDVEPYNQEVTLTINPRPPSSLYVDITPDGSLWLIQPVPDNISTLTLTVVATDSGSPQLTSTAEIRVDICRIKQPIVFCMSSTESTIKLCWKNPMPGNRFAGYNFTVSGEVNSTSIIPYIEEHEEVCGTVHAKRFQVNYTFEITIISSEPLNGDAKKITFNKTAKGVSMECRDYAFAICNYRNPCSDHGNCTLSTSKSFTCTCEYGWEGQDCSIKNQCKFDPCQNKGDCFFIGHEDYECRCAVGFYGKDCEFRNQCMTRPCQNSGICLPLDRGGFRCDCPPHSTGALCQNKDPCSPSPCLLNRGECIARSETNFTCQCNTGYSGDRCQVMDACILMGQPCSYQGTCVPHGDSFTCLCPPGTTGERCEKLEICYFKPCQNNASCTEGRFPGTYLCTCLPGFNGSECQNRINCYGVNCNHGECQENSTTREIRCKCFEGFGGTYCHQTDACSKSSCNGHGTCTSYFTDSNKQPSYTCSCFDGWSGIDCSQFNPCALHECKNGGICSINVLNQASCMCPRGYYLNDCSAFDPCSRHMCQNGGQCQNVSQERYVCNCLEGWQGIICEIESINLCSVENNPCLNNGQCIIVETTTPYMQRTRSLKNPGENSAVCLCQDGYHGQNCQYEKPCLTSPCHHGTCLSLDVDKITEAGQYLCTCDENFTGRNCDVDLCQDIDCLNNGYCTQGLCICPPPFTGSRCEKEVPECPESDNEDELSPPCGVDETMKNLQGLLDGTSEPSKLNVLQVKNFTEQLLDLYNQTLRDSKYARTAFRVLGNLAKVNTSVSVEAEKTEKVNSRLREFLDNYTLEVRTGQGGQINISVPEFQVKVMSIKTMAESSNSTISFQPSVTVNNTDIELNMTITIPSNILVGNSSNVTETRIQFIGYKRSQLFVPVGGFLDDGSLLHSQPVISASIAGREVANLTVPVEIRLFNAMPDKKYTCVFWDPLGSEWSTEGVTLSSHSMDSVTCASTHLTSFAILLDVNSDQSISKEHQIILTYLTYIGCGISTGCLIVTIITYAMFKCLNNEKSGKILLQLCTALLLLNITFLAATVDVSSYSDEGCLVVGMFLHYFLLAALMWMLVEAVEMYQALVTVFSKYQGLYLLKRCLLAWGIPVIIVGITAAVDSVSYYMTKEDRQFCFLTSKSVVAYYTSLVAPSCLIIIINSFVFIMVARVILRPNFQQQLNKDSTSVTPAQIRGAFTVMFLLGITWVFGPLAINEAQTVFSYLFCICNSLQGFLIFVFRCLFNPEAKLAWLQLIRTGTLKRRRGPIKSVYTDTTSKGGDNRRPSSSVSSGFTGTTRSTLSKGGNGFHPHPHQLHTTNGWHPNLNGLRRDEAHRENKNMFSPDDYISFPDKMRRLSTDNPAPTQGESVHDDNGEKSENEQTQF